MTDIDAHLSDQTLLLAADGELTPSEAARVAAHLAACWTCRTRRQEIEATVAEFMRDYRGVLDSSLPSADGPRALLKLRLEQLAETGRRSWFSRLRAAPFFQAGPLKLSWALAAVVCGVSIAAYFVSASGLASAGLGGWSSQSVAMSVPDRTLTPGATVLVSKEDVCRAPGEGNKIAPAALRQRVFDEYGIHRPRVEAYEVDYLITPALGGADDIRNLWPQSYASTVWNAQVKDVLEDRLRDMVCAGQLDLTTAQHEIAMNWIDAYKKYFHTDRPLPAAWR
jgi:hypothetical protein